MKTLRLTVLILFIAPWALAQKTDSLLQVQWEASLGKLKSGDLNDATIGFTQLINSGFSNKEVFLKRLQEKLGKTKSELELILAELQLC